MMPNYANDFESFGSKIWLNAASEGPLPLMAKKELEEAAEWKSRPYELTLSRFVSVPKELKKSISLLIGVDENDVIIANSASYGLHILANGLPWNPGDEILTMQNDFPTNILPWLALTQKGVEVKQIQPKNRVLAPAELSENISGKTRLFCISHVHTFSGYTLDIEAFAKICRERNIVFVVNVSQSAGTMPLNFSKTSADAVVCAGYKWLCGPYGAGFCWFKPQLRDSLDYNHAYWSAVCSEKDLASESALGAPQVKSARKFDVFGTANFFNNKPFRSAVDYWLKIGIDNVRNYHDKLLSLMIDGLKNGPFELISPQIGKGHSSLLVFSHQDKGRNRILHRQLIEKGIFTAIWKGNLRVSAHVYNTDDQIQTFLETLHQLSA